MENITTSAELKESIQLLEIEQYVSGQQLKGQFFTLYESFNAINIFKNSLKDVITSPFLIDNLLGTVVSIATSYFSNKMGFGVSGKIFRKLLFSAMRFVVKKAGTHSSQGIWSFVQKMIQHIPRNKQYPTQS